MNKNYENLEGFNCPFCGSAPEIDQLGGVGCSNEGCYIFSSHMPIDKWKERSKPTVDQTAWVFKCLLGNFDKKGTYRHLIYNIMEYKPKDYANLLDGMTINNLMTEDTE